MRPHRSTCELHIVSTSLLGQSQYHRIIISSPSAAFPSRHCARRFGLGPPLLVVSLAETLNLCDGWACDPTRLFDPADGSPQAPAARRALAGDAPCEAQFEGEVRLSTLWAVIVLGGGQRMVHPRHPSAATPRSAFLGGAGYR